MRRIRTAAVLGAGTMGAQIAAHLANAGVPTLLLDVTAEAAVQGLARARALKPDPFHTRDTHTLIRTGSLDDLSGLGGCDWIIEAIVERLDVKQALIERVEREGGDRPSSRPTPPPFSCRGSPRVAPTHSAGGGWGRTSSIRRAISRWSK